MSYYLGEEYIQRLLSHDEAYFNNILQFIGQNVSKEASILDVGSGVGSLVNILKARGYLNSYGIEMTQEYVNVGHNILGLHDSLFSYESARFEENSFDLVVSYTVAEHVDDIQAFVNFKLKFLKDGGIFFLFAPDYHRPKFYWNVMKAKLRKEELHLTPFTKGTVKDSLYMFMRTSFDLVRQKVIHKPRMIKVVPYEPEISVGGDADATWCCNYTDIRYCFNNRPDLLFQPIQQKGSLIGKVVRCQGVAGR